MKTLKDFSALVAAKVAGVPVDTVHTTVDGTHAAAAEATVETPVGPVFGIDIISLVTIIGQILTVISENCPQNDENLAKSMAAPTWKQRVQFGAEVRQTLRGNSEFRWRDRHAAISEACELCANELTQEERLAIVADTRTPDYNVL